MKNHERPENHEKSELKERIEAGHAWEGAFDPESWRLTEAQKLSGSPVGYDITVRFCDRYIDKPGRTHDQMVQAARSGVQNTAEGSQNSTTSFETELKLTRVDTHSFVKTGSSDCTSP